MTSVSSAFGSFFPLYVKSSRELLRWSRAASAFGIAVVSSSSATPSPTPTAVSSARTHPSRPPEKANRTPMARSLDH